MSGDIDRALGVIGTAVIDEIHPFRGGAGGGTAPVRSLGGVFYSLSALAALAPHSSFVVPVLRLGSDSASILRSALAGMGFDIRHLQASRVRQNRVELRYETPDRRREVLKGGVPPLGFRELRPVLDEVDVLYVNFVAGNELTLATLRRVRRAFRGPIYADLHSLLLGRAAGGLRIPRALADWREWVACADVVQCNADEAALLPAGSEPGPEANPEPELERLAREVLTLGPRLFLVTDGGRPVRAWPAGGKAWQVRPAAPSEARDPTGCGDVLGAAFCALHYMRGLPARRALRRAVEAASVAVTRVGTDDLAHVLDAWYAERHG